ncbi:clavesin-1-like [Aricia agestis]|uniref:clavesin-1-like n=1 Tax=Aricia agestis TaxID=91739 RepID=UPI001C208435|nr:clavesin-1-like [Aricia agestis]XP_041980773.1 clavesin-1-like [Aricia agestis]
MFEEIAFEAELNRSLDPECEDEARILCEEEPRYRRKRIEELRDMVYERGECLPPRIDDEFLLRFLRARRFVPARAHRLLVRYCQFRDEHPQLYQDVYWYDLTKLGHIFEGVLFDRPDVGRLIVVNLGKWNPDINPIEDLISCVLLVLEIGVMQPKLQVLGGTTIIDCEGIGFKHMRQLSPSVAALCLNVMGLAVPVQQRAVHIINCSRMFERLFYVFKRVAPAADEIWKKVHFHGYDLASLQRHIDPECLPEKYGGLRKTVTVDKWLTKIKKYKDKQFDTDLATMGYAV